MNRRTFIILAFIIVVMSVIVMSDRQDIDSDEVSLLLPGLDTELNEVTKLTIKAAGNRTVTTLMRGAERWTVAERGNYPADVGKIRQNLISLANATVVEQKTADPALYARLGVEDIANEDATGVELIIDGSNETYQVIIGKTGVRGDHAYARKPGSAVSLLIAANLDLGSEPTDWLDRTIIDVPSSDVSRVTTIHPDGETVRIEKSEADGFRPVDLPADIELTVTGVADSIGSALTELTLDDVSTRVSAGLKDVRPIVTRFETFDGLNIITNVYTDGDQHFVAFEFTVSDQNEATRDTATARAAELEARLGEWLFVIPGHKLEQLTHRLSDLLGQTG